MSTLSSPKPDLSFIHNEAMRCLPLHNVAPLQIPCRGNARFQPLRSSTCSILSLSSPFPIRRSRSTARPVPNALTDSASAAKHEEEEESEVSFKVLSAVRSKYNEIVIVDTPESTMLLLDRTKNIHSITDKGEDKFWTDSYWDEFATLPQIVPNGPIAILGLGAGTAARLMLRSSPSLKLHGWEIDEILIGKAREYFGLSDLETENESGGVLNVHVGDALSPSGGAGSYAGIVVDLFSGGKVLPEMEEAGTWLRWKEMLMPEGRIMVNCGGSDGGSGMVVEDEEGAKVNLAIQAISQAFGGQCLWKRLAKENGANYLALTGPLPDMGSWSASVPHRLSSTVNQWRPCS